MARALVQQAAQISAMNRRIQQLEGRLQRQTSKPTQPGVALLTVEFYAD